jgi:hypothetical protein
MGTDGAIERQPNDLQLLGLSASEGRQATTLDSNNKNKTAMKQNEQEVEEVNEWNSNGSGSCCLLFVVCWIDWSCWTV